MEKINVLLNTIPIIQQKAGIGYYTYNIYKNIKKFNSIKIYASHELMKEVTTTDKIIKRISNNLKKILKERYPTEIAARTYDTLILPAKTISTKKLKNIVNAINIYHETKHEVFKEMIPYLDRMKFIVDIHDLSPIIYPEWHLKNLVRRVRENFELLLSADKILTKSNFIKKQLINEFNVQEEKIVVIPNSTGGNYYPIDYKLIPESRKKLKSIIGDNKFILYTGTIEPRKNLITLFNAFKLLVSNPGYKDLRLVLAGKFGWKYNNILLHPKEIGIKDKVLFLGYISEETLLYLYNLCEFFVYPSWYEGFGIPPLEAMSCGTIPLVSNSSSLPEVVGDCGLLFDPESSEDLYEKMKYLMLLSKDEKKHLENRCLDRAKKFNWKDISKRIVQVYQEIYNENKQENNK